MSGDPPVCNALHAPIAGDIDCRDWEAGEKINRGVFYRQPLGYNLQSSVNARDAAIAREAHQVKISESRSREVRDRLSILMGYSID